MFGIKRKKERPESGFDLNDLVKTMDISVLLDKESGERYVGLGGTYMNGDEFNILMTVKLAKDVINTIKGELETEGL